MGISAMPPTERPKILEQLVTAMQKNYGSNSLRWMDETLERQKISTGIFSLDQRLHGGLPVGSLVQIYGIEQSGKSSLAASIAGHMDTVVYIDADRKMGDERARTFNLTSKNCILALPDTLEEALEVTLAFVKAGVKMVVIDSLPALPSRKELEEKHFDKQTGMAYTAGLLGRKLGLINDAAYSSKTIVLIVNQKRANMNAMPFGKQHHAFGGLMLPSMLSVNIAVAAARKLNYEGKDKGLPPYGQEIAYLIEKSTVSPPFLGDILPFVFNQGFVSYTDLPEARQLYLPEAKKHVSNKPGQAGKVLEITEVEEELQEEENSGE